MIKINELTKEYITNKSYIIALDSISLEFNNYGIVLIKGASGSGKTTLLNIISGFETKTNGYILHNINDVSFSLQNFTLINFLTIKESLDLIQHISNFDNYKKLELINELDVSDIMQNYPNEISGGQKQKISLMISIMLDKKIILCDEPSSSLDEKNSLKIINLLEKYSKNRLIIIATHEKHLFDSYADRILYLDKGKIKRDIYHERIKIEEKNDFENSEKIDFKKAYLLNFISFKLFKNNIFRSISFLIFLILSFIPIYINLSLATSSLEDSILNIYNNESIDFLKGDSYDMQSISPNEYIDLYNQNLNFNTFSYSSNEILQINNIDINKIYYDNCDHNILYGTNSLVSDTLLISLDVASLLLIDLNLLDVDDLINCSIFIGSKEFTIIGIYTDSFSNTSSNMSISITKNDYNEIIFAHQTSICVKVDDIQSDLVYLTDNVEDLNIIHGEKVELKDDEIGINATFANYFFEDINALIDKYITIDFYQYYEEIEYLNSTTFKIKYIFFDSSAQYISCSDSTYYSLFFSVSTIGLNKHLLNGINLYNYDSNDISSLLNSGYFPLSIYTEDLAYIQYYFITINTICLIVFFIFYILVIVILVKTFIDLFYKQRQNIGLLISYGLSKFKVLFYILFDTLSALFVSIFLSIIVQFALIDFLNNFLMKKTQISIDVVYFNFKMTIIVTLIILLLLLTCFISTILIINRKTRRELIAG